MKKVIAVAVILGLCLFLIPMGIRHENQKEESPDPSGSSVQSLSSDITLKILHDDVVTEMDLEQYLWGVVAAEMPASFHVEALKAQAVAARTYSLSKAGHATSHPEADLCTYSGCCQAWTSEEDARAGWAGDADFYADRITQAVRDTQGEVLTYEGQLIDALFHASSGDMTQDAVAVWGNHVPYLVSVPSPEGEEVTNLWTTVAVTAQEFQDTLRELDPAADFTGSPADWLGPVTYSNGGSVDQITLAGVTLTGQQVRSAFGLRSAVFTVAAEGDTITFTVVGHGHGVGMSQYGANAMAQEGSTYDQILTHYYTGVTLEPYAPAEES